MRIEHGHRRVAQVQKRLVDQAGVRHEGQVAHLGRQAGGVFLGKKLTRSDGPHTGVLLVDPEVVGSRPNQLYQPLQGGKASAVCGSDARKGIFSPFRPPVTTLNIGRDETNSAAARSFVGDFAIALGRTKATMPRWRLGDLADRAGFFSSVMLFAATRL